MKHLRYISRYMLYPSLLFCTWIVFRAWLPKSGKLDLFVAAAALIIGAVIAHKENGFDKMEQESKRKQKEQDLLVWVDVPIEEQEPKAETEEEPEQKQE